MFSPSKHMLAFGRVLLLALVIRLALALLPGYVDDQRSWATLGRIALRLGIPNLYATTQFHPLLGIYPPLYHYALAFVGLVYQGLFSPEFAIPSTSLYYLLKLVPILGDCALGIAIYMGSRGDLGEKNAMIAASAILFSPGILYASAYWGMFGDSLYTLAIVGALLAILRGRLALGWSAIIAGMMFKPQTIAFIPIIVLAGLRSAPPREWLKAGLISLGVAVAIWLPFIIAGTVPDAINALSLSVGLFPHISANAHNAWWLVMGGDGWANDTEPLIGAVSALSIGLGAFGLLGIAAMGWSMLGPLKDRLIHAAAFTAFAFFMVSTEMHENYLFPAVALLALLIAEPGPMRWIGVAVNVTWLINMILVDPALSNGVLASWPLRELGIVVSAANVIILVVWAIVLVRGPGSSGGEAEVTLS